jgi:2-polyprenyl-3-methyl-5-hydroxy-6-metoxy-1,4-benzoquinol methylase
MTNLKEVVNNSSSFYFSSILSFDYKLCEYNFKTFQPFFRGELCLELGPATGYMTKKLVDCFKEIHLVEGAIDLLEKIPDYPNVKKNHSLFEDYKCDIQYDTIVMGHVLEHISEPVPLLKKIYSWLSSDGVLLISVPNAKSIHRTVAVEMGLLESIYTLNNRDRELGHYRVYDMDALKNDVSNAGFKILDSGGIFLKPVSNKQIEENWTDDMVEGFYRVSPLFKEFCAEIFVVCVK